MIVVLGASGYIGQAYVQELQRRGAPMVPLTRRELDYTRFASLSDYLQSTKPAVLINAAGFMGKPNVDACESAKAETLLGNVLLAQTVAHACLVTETPWLHVSSGCIYDGAFVCQSSKKWLEKDLRHPEIRSLFEGNREAIRGFTEDDEPNFSFRHPPCSFYGGSKALAEEAIAGVGRSYIVRLRMPFDQLDNPRNFLTKVQRYARLYDNINSLSHLGESVCASLALWERRAPCGIYNLTNPGFVSMRQVVGMIQRILKPARSFAFWESDEEFYREGVKTPRSNCVLDVSKLLNTGIRLRPVEEALEDSLKRWQRAPVAAPAASFH